MFSKRDALHTQGKKRSISQPRRLISAALCVLMLPLTLAAGGCTQTTRTDNPASAVWPSHASGTTIYAPATSATVSLPEGIFPTAGVGVDTSAKAHLLIEASSGAVLARKNADVRLPMASTTKIMTALVALETLPLDRQITIPAQAVGIEGSSVYLTEGEVLSLSDLLYALLLESANDAAVAIACAAGGSVEEFADMMNRRAQEMGLSDTHFVNPHGLDHEEHYTTAHDLAVITKTAMQNEDFCRIVSTRKTTIPMASTGGVRLLLNHNKMLQLYDGCIGVKTGYTKKTGRCLVSAATRDGVTLIAVTLGCPDDWKDHTALLDYGFSVCTSVELIAPGGHSAALWTVSGQKEYVMASNRQGVTLTLPVDHGKIECVAEYPRFLYAPLADGQTVGRLVYYVYVDGHRVQLCELPITAEYAVDEIRYKESLWERLRSVLC